MLANQYLAKNEFELLGELQWGLTEQDFKKGSCRVLCFAKHPLAGWQLVDSFETPHSAECARYFVEKKKIYFMLLLSAKRDIYEVTFQGEMLSAYCEFIRGRLSFIDFEDRKPNEAFRIFEKQELQKSVTALKKIFHES